MSELLVVDLGLVPYGQALEMQRAVARDRIAGRIPEDVLLLVEHPPVVTLGRGARDAHLLASPEFLSSHGIDLYEVERGGDVTFHGPGQLVGYPIIDLKRHRQDLHWYLRQVEEALIHTLAAFGLQGTRHTGYTGVWTQGMLESTPDVVPAAGGAQNGASAPDKVGVDPHQGLRKIASIGVHARDWVTWHGFALNVTTDLSYFDLIVPCGIPEVTMTSMARELGGHVELSNVRQEVARSFAGTFGLTPTPQARIESLTVPSFTP